MTTTGTQPRTSLARWLNLIAVVLALAAAIVVVFAPLGSSVSGADLVDAAGTRLNAEATYRHSLLSTEGPRILVIVALPVVISAVPLVASSRSRQRHARMANAAALTVMVLLGAASIGFILLPALAAMIASAAVTPTTTHRAFT